MKIFNVVAARPNFMKVGPLHRAFERRSEMESILVHTGQHYDEQLSEVFFEQLELPEPDIYLGAGSGSHAAQTARVMISFEGALMEHRPDIVVVIGDMNSTLACSLVAAKCHIPVAHVEAGLRSGDRRMPEEINRIVTDSISDYMFVTEQSGLDNLAREGVPDDRVFFVGNVTIDSLIQFRKKAAEKTILHDLGIGRRQYVLMTMHRPTNVDVFDRLERLVEIIEQVTSILPVVLPIHPRTRNQLQRHGFLERFQVIPQLIITEPLGYLEFLKLMDNAAVVLTDSGGVQEETTYLRVPCITLRDTTERPITTKLGTNVLMPLNADAVADRVMAIQRGDRRIGEIPPLWDGFAADRIADIMEQILRLSMVAH